MPTDADATAYSALATGYCLTLLSYFINLRFDIVSKEMSLSLSRIDIDEWILDEGKLFLVLPLLFVVVAAAAVYHTSPPARSMQ